MIRTETDQQLEAPTDRNETRKVRRRILSKQINPPKPLIFQATMLFLSSHVFCGDSRCVKGGEDSGRPRASRGFGPLTTAEEIVGHRDLTGRRFLVTGANTGIGYETVRCLLSAGAIVTLVCRSAGKVDLTRQRLQQDCPEVDCCNIESIAVDLSMQSSVRQGVADFLERRDADGSPLLIDTLIGNAGVAEVPFALTEDGYELTMASNYFGHFSLSLLLLPRVTNRIVLVSSRTHQSAPPLDISRLNFQTEDEYDAYKAYAQSKLAEILFAKELNAKLKRKHSSVEVFSLHPGLIVTELGRYSEKVARHLEDIADKTIAQGASTTLYATLEESLKGSGGSYLVDCSIGSPALQARNLPLAKELFAQTERITGVYFDSSLAVDGIMRVILHHGMKGNGVPHGFCGTDAVVEELREGVV